MMALNLKLILFGEWKRVERDLEYLERKTEKALERSIKKEARSLSKELKKELKTGGNPKFPKISKFTRAIRKATGVSSRKAGIASKQVYQSIKDSKVDQLTYLSGVRKGTPHKSRGMIQDASKLAMMLELGRKPVTLILDKPSSRTGKTPRQWLWWLYFQGALKNPPRKSKEVIELKAAPKRPFAKNVFEREKDSIPNRVMSEFIEIAKKNGLLVDLGGIL